MTIEHLIVVRHGDYGVENLTEKGKSQITELTDKFKEIVVDPVAIYSSPVDKAYESAEIIAKNLGVSEVRTEGYLEDACNYLNPLDEILENMKNSGAKSIIVVSHLGVVEAFLGIFVRRERKLGNRLPFDKPDYGEGYWFDTKNNEVRSFPSGELKWELYEFTNEDGTTRWKVY